MSVVNLYNGIYRTLSNDEDVLNYLGLGKEATNLQKSLKIQKRAKPQNLTDNIPLITFYAPPGRRESGNLEVYNVNFHFDIYTRDDVDTAQRVGQRIIELFEGKVPNLKGVENFESLFVTAHESETDLDNTYCFTVVINFNITLN